MSSASKKKRRKRRPRSAAPAAAPADPAAAPAAKEPVAASSRARVRRRPVEAPPPAPWGSFPLVELVVFVGIVMLVLGFIVGLDEARGQTLLATGFALAGLAGLELSIREHFAGYRSHTTLLAGAVTVALLAALYYIAGLTGIVSVAIAAPVGALAAAGLLRVFRARSGGRSFKIR